MTFAGIRQKPVNALVHYYVTTAICAVENSQGFVENQAFG